MNTTTMATMIHEGRNVKRIREILGIKQETLASQLNINQQKMSFIEGKEKIDEELMEQIAKALNVPVEAIKNYNEESTVYYIQHNHEGANAGSGTLGNNLTYHDCNFNPIDEYKTAIEEIKKLYERLLQSEKEKVELLEGLLKDRK